MGVQASTVNVLKNTQTEGCWNLDKLPVNNKCQLIGKRKIGFHAVIRSGFSLKPLAHPTD